MAEYNPKEFAESWLERLRSKDAYEPETLFLPGRETEDFGQAFRAAQEKYVKEGSTEGREDLWKRYQTEYFPQVEELARRANRPTIGEEIDEFVKRTGLQDPRRNSFPIEDARHEIHSHLRPFQAGFMPDYRNLPLNIEGLPETFKANPVSPKNEKLALLFDNKFYSNPRYRGLSSNPTGGAVDKFRTEDINKLLTDDLFSSNLRDSLIKQATESGRSKPDLVQRVDEFISENYPTESTRSRAYGTNLSSVSSEIADQLNTKYLPGATAHKFSMERLFYPTGGATHNSFNDADAFQNYFRFGNDDVAKAAMGLSNPGTGYMSGVPLPKNFSTPRALKGSLAFGASDFIPSREAVKSFAQGDIKGGLKNMAGEFVQGIPAAATAGVALGALPAAAAAVATPALAVYGLSGVIRKTGEALDEVTRQQTGEGLVSKLQQFLYKATDGEFGRPPTGAAYRGSERFDDRQRRVINEGRQALADLPATVQSLSPETRARLGIKLPKTYSEGWITVPGKGRRWRTSTGEYKLEQPRQTTSSTRSTNRTSTSQRDWNYTPEIRQITPQQARASQPPARETEWQRRLRLAGQRFNPGRGEFGFTELLFGK